MRGQLGQSSARAPSWRGCPRAAGGRRPPTRTSTRYPSHAPIEMPSVKRRPASSPHMLLRGLPWQLFRWSERSSRCCSACCSRSWMGREGPGACGWYERADGAKSPRVSSLVGRAQVHAAHGRCTPLLLSWGKDVAGTIFVSRESLRLIEARGGLR